jgi:hypothetical protein
VSRPSFWTRCAVSGIAAASEAAFPENTIGAPDFRSTDMVSRTLEYLEELPPDQHRLVKLLFVFVELAAVLLVFGFRRFSRIPMPRRTEVIRGWRRSRFLPLRLLGDALKATTTMMYMSHPSVIAHIGEYRSCDHPADELEIEVRSGALAGMEAE